MDMHDKINRITIKSYKPVSLEPPKSKNVLFFGSIAGINTIDDIITDPKSDGEAINSHCNVLDRRMQFNERR